MKPSPLQAALRPLLRPFAAPAAQLPIHFRCVHGRSSYVPEIPSPTPFIPDVKSFLTAIGRGLSQHSSKFPTWEALFSLTSPQLRELGIEPPRTRRYLIKWRNKFQQGLFGPGGDMKYVQDGKAKLVIEQRQVAPLEYERRVLNVPFDFSPEYDVLARVGFRPRGYSVRGVKSISGPYVLPLSGHGEFQVMLTEGMWEDKRGHKIDGGERRKSEIRFKKRIAERKAEREAMGLA